MQITGERLTAEAWAPFGWIPVADTNPADGEHRLSYEWADPHANVISHNLDELDEIDGGLRCDKLFRHLTHTQVLMVIDHPAVIAVAPAGRPPEEVRAFLLEPLESLVLHRGTWHWGPYPTTTAEVRLFNVQGLRYAEDNEMFELVEPVDVLAG